MRVLVVSDHRLLGQGMEEWLRQQAGLDVVGRAADMGQAAQAIEQLQPDVILLEVSDQARDPTAALMRFVRNGSGTKVIGVNLGDDCISIYYEGHRAMQGVGDLLRIIQEVGNIAGGECQAEEVESERQDESEHES